MNPIFKTEIFKFKGSHGEICDDTLVREVKLQISANGQKVGAIMATPVDLDALAVGYLLSENIISSRASIEQIKISDDGLGIDLLGRINEAALKRLESENIIISGCGRSQTANIDPDAMAAKIQKDDFKFKKSEISKQMSEFYTQCELYEKTGCVHTAKLCVGGRFYIGEDIAQHNTIDKAIGKAVLDGQSLGGAMLLVSGRLSSEMVVKAVMNSICLLVSRTAPTSLGVLIARKFNLTLCGFARGENLNIYSAQERIYA